ncbi:hypothetical protein AMAG_10739 [Allomyces macrogynus ATCC 38327]|uniref:Uncharacterized protein n=1 Tax=Allomyces macrogynus (strain ATCC 38327) TaxID=578462 RepID=A0A0L0SRV3_ALLM3|nr:hypothetical protein AMAG_10739 [Allomyces macrogynus ATCC 38327]|eukprot:KNE65079.1 hypothetical protein AMAG_10739 [Allomyces macrogynus ATCC 38327]
MLLAPSCMNAEPAPVQGRRRFPATAATAVNPIVPPPLPSSVVHAPPPFSGGHQPVLLRIKTGPTSVSLGRTDRASDQRWPRVTNNVRNESSQVWKLDVQLGFRSASEHYQTDAAEDERVRRLSERLKKEQFWDARRTRWEQMDQTRWLHVRVSDEQARRLQEAKRQRSKLGQSSVGYDIVSSGYLTNLRGQRLHGADSAARVP